ncbi:MAG: hypothetical protein ACLTX3_06775 [Lachnospiraceae bacterium]
MVTITNRRKMSSDSVDISPILFKNCKAVCYDVVEKLKSVYDYFSDYSYIICTGGTYDAWKEDFDEVFKDMKTLHRSFQEMRTIQVCPMYSLMCVGIITT